MVTSYKCLICEEKVPQHLRIYHLREHRLSINDLSKFRIFGWDVKDLNIPIAKDNDVCPHCKHDGSHAILCTHQAGESVRYLIRCPECRLLYFVFRIYGIKTKDHSGDIKK